MFDFPGLRWTLGWTMFAASTGCSGKLVDIGGNADAGVGPVYAVSAPPVSEDAGELSPLGWKLVDDDWPILNFVADGGRVFWFAAAASNSPPRPTWALRSCEVARCKSTVQVLNIYVKAGVDYSVDDSRSLPMAVNGTDVFLLNPQVGSGVAYCSKESCPSFDYLNPTAGIGTQELTFDVDDTYLYFATEGVVGRCEVSDCAATVERFAMVAPPGESSFVDAVQVRLEGDYLYIASLDGRIIRTPKDGTGVFQVIARDPQTIVTFAVGGGYVFWAEQPPMGRMLSCPIGGCTGDPRVLASNLDDLSADDEYVYFTQSLDPMSRVLRRCPVADCSAPTTLAESPTIGTLVTSDDKFVYFAGSSNIVVGPTTELHSYISASRK